MNTFEGAEAGTAAGAGAGAGVGAATGAGAGTGGGAGVAQAKVTRSLRITGVRADGYHLLDTEMVAVEWGDELRIEAAETTSLVIDGPFAAGVPTDDSNLVVTALRRIGRSAAVRLTKRIPHGGGLGGGSSDAAAVLRWAGVDDTTTAASLGADVPFCVRGGRARVTGIGEIVEPLPHLDLVFTLVIPPLSVSTPLAYRAWDALGGPRADGANDLEPAALMVEPRLARWRDRIAEVAGRTPTLAGSGAAWFVEAEVAGMNDALPDAVVVVTRSARPHPTRSSS